jgi:sugar lactone lactonase YvrE
VNRLDEQLRHSLNQLSSGIGPDPHDLLVVRRRAQASRRRARAAVVAGIAVAGVVAGAVVQLGHGTHTSRQPIGPLPSSTDTTQREILVTNPFTVARTIDASTVGIHGPLRVAVAPNGHVYVSDRRQHVTELTATGAVVRRWGGQGTAAGKFRLYSGGLTVGPDGRVYVVDTGNFRIQVFSPTGRFLAEYGGYGQGPGKFVWPSDIVVGTDGTMYVTDDRAATLTALSSSGEQLWRRGQLGEPDPDLIGHEHLGGVTAEGELVTANDDVGKVLYLGPKGRIVDAFSAAEAGGDLAAPGGHFPRGACGATLDSQGYVYVSSCEESYQAHHDTAVFDPQHRLVAGWKRGPLADAPVFAPDGEAWAVRSGKGALLELTVNLPGN